MRDDDARGGTTDAVSAVPATDERASGPRVVVRTPSGAGDSQMVGAADTAVASQSQAMAAAATVLPDESDHDDSVDDETDYEDDDGDEDNLIGEVLLERYEITRKIGQGGMGAVYEARHALIGKRMAVKVLLEKYADRDQVVARLKQEAELASSIGHEHIIDITDFGTTPDGRTFVVMEFLEGESLGACIQRDGPLPEQRAIRIAHQIASALHAAHEKGILHRDVKPENVFLLTRKGADFVKVVDFGISKSMRTDEDGGSESPRLTQTGMVLGTPLYMSPEQARGAEHLDRRIDVYSLGVILYEMITGEVPFHGSNYLNIISQVLNSEPRNPSEIRPGISSDLEAIILKALDKDPDERYASCAELADDLALLFTDTGHTTSRGRITAAKHRRKRNRRSGLRILAWVAGVAVTIGAVAVTVAVLMSGKSKQSEAAPPAVVVDAAPRVVKVMAPPGADAAPAVKIARIEIITTPPGATVYLGDREIGTTPFIYPTPREHKELELIAELPAHNDAKFIINPYVDDGKPVKVRLEKPKSGKVKKIRRKKTGKKNGKDAKTDGKGTSDGTTDKPDGDDTAWGELSGDPFAKKKKPPKN